jgi:hypothetical protein
MPTTAHLPAIFGPTFHEQPRVFLAMVAERQRQLAATELPPADMTEVIDLLRGAVDDLDICLADGDNATAWLSNLVHLAALATNCAHAVAMSAISPQQLLAMVREEEEDADMAEAAQAVHRRSEATDQPGH